MTDVEPQTTLNPAPNPANPHDTSLERLERRLASIEASLERLTSLVDQTPALAATAADGFDELVARLGQRGVDVDARIHAALGLVEKLSDPATIANLERALAVADGVPGLVAAAGDTFDQLVASLAARGVNVDERLQTVLQVAERLTAPEALAAVCEVLGHVDQLHALLASGVFDPAAVRVVSDAAGSLAQTRKGDIPPVGLFGALRALGDPDVRRSLGLAVQFGRAFGATLEHGPRSTNGPDPTASGVKR